jgi:signal transduction histidine kinase
MGRTQAVIPLLGGPGHAEARWRPKMPISGTAETKGRRMKLPNWMRPPGRTVRVRLTALYGVMFLVSGALLLAIASGVAVARSTSVAQAAPVTAQGTAPAQGRVQQLQAQVQSLQAQLTGQHSEGRLSRDLLIASLLALALMTLISVALGWLVAGRALRPVREMTTAAQRISENNLDERLAVQGPKDELKELGDTIDGLLERLEIAFRAQRRFVANASHELRTPLTTMRAALDVALAKPEPVPPQTAALAARLRMELDRVDQLLEAFLMLARAQHGSLPGQSVLPLDYLIASALSGQAATIRARKLTVQETSDPGGAWVAGSQALISRLVENVIDNAVCHNTEGGWIRITSRTADGWASVVVENGGPVLEPEQVRELSQPFRRIGADRTSSDEGSGLGLSIVDAVAEAHGGSLDLQARQGGGLRVSIRLPAVAGVPTGARA